MDPWKGYNEWIDYCNRAINERKKLINRVKSFIPSINRDYDRAIGLISLQRRKIEKGEKVDSSEISSIDKNWVSYRKDILELFHWMIIYKYPMTVGYDSAVDMKEFQIREKNAVLKEFWIEGFYNYQSIFYKELGSALGIDVSVLRDNLPHYMTIYTTPPPDIEDFFKSIGTRGANTINYYLHVKDRICTISMNRYYTCRILYMMVRSVMKNEDIMNEADDVKLFCEGTLIPETSQSITEVFRNTNEMTMEIIHQSPQISYKKYRITSIRQFRTIPSSTNYLILDYRDDLYE